MTSGAHTLKLIQGSFPFACALTRAPRHRYFVAFPCSKISSTTKQKLYLKSLDISQQRSTVFRRNGGVFRGNSRITSDSSVYTFRLLYASRNCSEFVYWSWLSEWIVQPDLPCCDLQPLSRVITPRRSEWSLSREPRQIMINSLAKTTLSLITTRQITFHIICMNVQVVFFENNSREFGTLNAVCEEIIKLHTFIESREENFL